MNAIPAPNTVTQPHANGTVRLFQMRPGFIFRCTSPAESLPHQARGSALAMLSSRFSPVSDNTKIYVVVIGTSSGSASGEFFGLPRETPVQRMHVTSPMQLAAEH